MTVASSIAIDRGPARPAAAVGLVALAVGGGARAADHLELGQGSGTTGFATVVVVLTVAALGAAFWARPPIHGRAMFMLPWMGAGAVAVVMASMALVAPDVCAALGPAALEAAGGLGLLSAVARGVEATIIERYGGYRVSGQAKAELHHDATTSSLVPASALVAKDEIRISAGERLPVDGRLSSEGGEVDESAVMGDGPPVAKARRDPVFAATVARTSMRVEVEAPWADSWAAQRDARHDEVARRLTMPDPLSRATAGAATVIAAAVAGLAMTRAGPVAIGEWMPTVAAVLMATAVMSESLGRMRARLGLLHRSASAGWVIARCRDLSAMVPGGRWFVDPALIGIPARLEVRPVGGFSVEALVAAAGALTRHHHGLLPAALRSPSVAGRASVGVALQALDGVYRGTIDGHRWFLAPSSAVEDQLDPRVVVNARASMSGLDGPDRRLWWIGRDERTLEGAIVVVIDIERRALSAARALQARWSPLDPDASTLSALTAIPVAEGPPGPRDVTVAAEGTPAPRAGACLWAVEPRLGRRLSATGAPVLMRPAVDRWAAGWAAAAGERVKALRHGWLVLVINMSVVAVLALTEGLMPWVGAGLGLAALWSSVGRPPPPANFSGRW